MSPNQKSLDIDLQLNKKLALLWNGPHINVLQLYIYYVFIVILSFANVNAENIMQKMVPSDGVGRFGYSVSIHNNTALVGSYDMMGSSGAAYMFDRVNTGWTQTAKLVANDSVAPGDFGISVSIDNNIALIASFGDAYIFEKVININQILWTQTARLVPNDGTAFSNFGYSVSIHNNSALIGWPGNGIDSGSAYIFEKVNEVWTQTARLVPNDAANDHFGTSVSIHNNIALIGSPSPGHAYIFEKVNGVWTQTEKLVANDGVASDNFGTSVSINNNNALVGSPYNDAMGYKSGSAYIFEKVNATWTQTTKLVANDGVAGDEFGMEVSIENNIALIAAWMSNSYSGSAYIFEKVNAIWTQTAKLVGNDGDRFGCSVSIHNNIALIGTFVEKVYAIKNYNSCYNVWFEASDKNGLLDTQNNYLINYMWTTCMFSRNQTYTSTPTNNPTITPTMRPSMRPIYNPTMTPTNNPTMTPTNNPTMTPFTPTNNPTMTPTIITLEQTIELTPDKLEIDNTIYNNVLFIYILTGGIGLCVILSVLIFIIICVCKKNRTLTAKTSNLQMTKHKRIESDISSIHYSKGVNNYTSVNHQLPVINDVMVPNHLVDDDNYALKVPLPNEQATYDNKEGDSDGMYEVEGENRMEGHKTQYI